jgi:rubrerythrin
MATSENLQAAFAGESQASRKYTYFAEKADASGEAMIARLFRAAAEAETVHARNHLNVMKGIGSVKENLEAAIGGEHYEFDTMYPGFIKDAEAESQKDARRSFDLANRVEAIHHKLFNAALADLEAGKKKADTPIYVCQTCGNTVWGEAPERCPVCGAVHGQFKKIN